MRLAVIPLICMIWSLPLCGEVVSEITKGLERHFRPGDTEIATPVKINSFIIDIMEIDDVRGTMTLDYFITQRWNDPRLADENFSDPLEKLNLTIDDIWNPHIVSVNLRESAMQDRLMNIDSQGNVTFRQRRIDTFTTPLNLRNFPFDRQSISLRFLSSVYASNEIDLVWDEARSGHLGDFSLSGWTFESFAAERLEQSVQTVTTLDNSLIGLQFTFKLKRDPAFYIWKVFFPLGLIVFMAWTVFWIDPANFGGQVAISTASVITLIAFQLSLSELLPRISYLTKIDLYAVGTSLMVFLALGESILTARLAKIEKHRLSLIIDQHMRWVYPLAYLILTLLVII